MYFARVKACPRCEFQVISPGDEFQYYILMFCSMECLGSINSRIYLLTKHFLKKDPRKWHVPYPTLNEISFLFVAFLMLKV